MTKYLLLLLPLTVYANGNHYENSHHDDECRTEIVHSERPIERVEPSFKSYDAEIAINAAIASMPTISHHKGHSDHKAMSFGIGSYESSQAIAIGYEQHHEESAYRLNIGVSRGTSVVGGGFSYSF